MGAWGAGRRVGREDAARLRAVRGLAGASAPGGAEGGPGLFGGKDLALWALLVMLHTSPSAEEVAQCPSQIFRDLAAMSAGRRRLCLVLLRFVTAPFMVLMFCLQSLFAFRRGPEAARLREKGLRLVLTRPDLVSFAHASRWSTTQRDLFGAVAQFSDVDIHRLNSLAIRSGIHITDMRHNIKQGLMEDKQAFHEACRRHGLPSVPSIESREDALAVLESGGALFAKPRLLQWGWGACIIKSAQDPKLDEILAKPEEFLLQERLQNQADFRGCLSPDAPMCTARITTFWTPEGYKVLESWIRCGASGATADHMENGGTSFAVFAETGVVWKGTSGELMRTPGQAPLQPTIRRAKGAERDISGERLPNWEETVQTCMRAHAAVAKDAFTVGWDIAFTDRGTYLVEANLLSMVSLHIGMRFGNMAMLFPDSPLVNVAMAEWLCDKPGGVPRTALRARLEAARQETKELLSATTSEAFEKEMKILDLRKQDPEKGDAESLAALQADFQMRQGEVMGLEREMRALDSTLARLSKSKKAQE